MPYDITYVWTLKYKAYELICNTEQTHRHTEQTWDCHGSGEGWGESLGLTDANCYL